MSKKLIAFSILLIVVIGGIGYLILSRSYPVALVNWSLIDYSSFKKDTAAAARYYANALEIYNKGQASLVDAPNIKLEIQRAVLDRLIESSLINRQLRKLLADNDITSIVNSKIELAIGDADISKEVEELYGLSLTDFKENVLKPQAEQELLEGRFILENKNMSDWLNEERSKARVVILIPNFSWNGKEVVVSK